MIRVINPSAGMRVELVMEDGADLEELAKVQARRERFERNTAWLWAHAGEVYPRNLGKFICVAGEELFAGATPEEALARAKAAHPEDDGCHLSYIPREKVGWIYELWRVELPS